VAAPGGGAGAGSGSDSVAGVSGQRHDDDERTSLLWWRGRRRGEQQHGLGRTVSSTVHGAPPHRPHEEFNFDCLSEVCNSYRSCDGVVLGPGVVHGAGQALAQEPLHDAMAEDDPSGGNLHRGGGSPSSPVPFIFGAGGAGESSEMTRGVFSGAHPRSKLNGGTTSKNLMAERRRRKRLNDRLSMLRSIVPKIIKMDRTSILGDTIDYVNELTERIKTLEEEIGATPEELNLL
ncbi:hypothetical protein CFC21_068851, partial [Triticum aestivum]